MAITGKTKILGVIGNPISHTASPLMQNAMLSHLGLSYIYIPILVEPKQLNHFLTAIRATNFVGVNVTIPFKEQVLPFLDELDETARRIGAVNTIVNRNGYLKGYNTDGAGFIMALDRDLQMTVSHKRVCLIGAGGAAHAIAFSLLSEGVSFLGIFNRTHTRAKALVDQLSIYFGRTLCQVQASPDFLDYDIIINTTPVGMASDEIPIPNLDWVRPTHLLCDIVYKPLKTKFLALAEKKGAKICNGIGMLVGQGVLSFELFTGQKADYYFMKKILEDL